jgi:anaerobic magnesium-protoporphyrin IX monomethyl ester cyclase
MIACGPSSREHKVRQPDILFTNAYHIGNDHHEQIGLRPYSALGPLYVAAYPREHGYTVGFFDSVFQTNDDVLLTNVRLRKPRFVGISALVIGRATAREQIRARKELGCTVIAGGPDPSNVPGTYLRECGAAARPTAPSAAPGRPRFLP